MIYELKITTSGALYEEKQREHIEWLQRIGFKFEGDPPEEIRPYRRKVEGYVTVHSTLDDVILNLTDTGQPIIISKEKEDSKHDYEIEIYDDWRE